MKFERTWPYVLPFPLDSEKRKMIWSVLQSRVGLRILGEINIDKKTYQHDLIEKLPYSNKSVIKYLKKMVKAMALEEGREAHTEKGRIVWVKWFKPKGIGKWLILFLKTPSEVSLDLTKKVIEELFQLYASSIVEVCQKYKLNIDSFHRNLDKQFILEIIERQQPRVSEVAVFGSAALDIYGVLKKIPAPEEVTFVEETGRYPGGMGANVAVALARLNVPVTFFSKIGKDSGGRILIENLVRNNVDISKVQLSGGSSLQTLILSDSQKLHRWLFTIGSPVSAISLTSLREINWKTLDNCRIVYVGEIFVEIASAIAASARRKNKLVIYRPGVPYTKFGLKVLHRILRNVNIFILNQGGWKNLLESSREELRDPEDLLRYGPKIVILTKGKEGCKVYSADRTIKIPVPSQLRVKFRIVDPTGSGDGFSAGLIKGLLQHWSLEKAIAYGQVVASITCSRVGACNAFPTDEAVKAIIDLKF